MQALAASTTDVQEIDAILAEWEGGREVGGWVEVRAV